jgi:ATP-dependent DNA ligase
MIRAAFIPPMLLRRGSLPEGPDWRYELKHDGYRAIAFRSRGQLHLRSRNNKDFAIGIPEYSMASQIYPMKQSSTAKLWLSTNGKQMEMCSGNSISCARLRF